MHGWHRCKGKTTVLFSACSKSLVDIKHYIFSKICHHARLDPFVASRPGMRVVEWSYPSPLVGRLFYRLRPQGSTYPPKCKRHKLGLWSNLSSEHAAKWQSGFCTTSKTVSGLSYNPKEVIQPIKEITAIRCLLSPAPRINLYVDILIWSYL